MLFPRRPTISSLGAASVLIIFILPVQYESIFTSWPQNVWFGSSIHPYALLRLMSSGKYLDFNSTWTISRAGATSVILDDCGPRTLACSRLFALSHFEKKSSRASALLHRNSTLLDDSVLSTYTSAYSNESFWLHLLAPRSSVTAICSNLLFESDSIVTDLPFVEKFERFDRSPHRYSSSHWTCRAV